MLETVGINRAVFFAKGGLPKTGGSDRAMFGVRTA